MLPNPDIQAPYPFRQNGLDSDVLRHGMAYALQAFELWRNSNAPTIANHVDELTGTLDEVAVSYSWQRRLGRLVIPKTRGEFEDDTERQWIRYFGLHNLGEALDGESVDYLQVRLHHAREIVDARRTRRDAKRDMLGTVFRSVEELAPELQGLAEMDWLKQRVDRLRWILPDNVMEAGGMGKVMRTIMGVLAITVYDVRDEPSAARREHLRHVIPGAYILGSTYALVDDTVQSNSGKALSVADKEKIHVQLAHGLATGEPIDASAWPEHPLAEELEYVYSLLTERYSFGEYRHLYHAIEAMYLSQRRDSQLTPEAVAANGGIRSMYPDMAIKAAMTRVVANILGRQEMPEEVYERVLNGVFISQLKDDFQDRFTDIEAGDCTPFSLPTDMAVGNTSPLYDLFAFAAYRAHVVWGDHPQAMEALVRYDPSEIGPYIARNPKQAIDTLHSYPHTPEIARFILRAVDLSPLPARQLMPQDMRLEHIMSTRTQERDPLGLDPRTFVSDRLDFLNETVAAAFAGTGMLEEVADYSLSAGGKRLRPALTLMLAESLGVPYDQIRPLIQTIELIHTSSLILDDLPAQDNATQRRGRPTVHVAYPEWAAQLASISMISRGFGILPNLNKHFPADRVNEVVRYADRILGFGGLCEGQAMDLGMDANASSVNKEDIIRMYSLKTSQAIAAALVPLMILQGRPQEEVDLLERFAYDAGIVFQLRDDILDLTSSPELLGKDADNDGEKKNIARLYGCEEAERLLGEHLASAISSCRQLPFDSRLLEGIVGYFATRKK